MKYTKLKIVINLLHLLMRENRLRNKIGFYILFFILLFTIISLNVTAKTVIKAGDDTTVVVNEELEFQGVGEGEYFWDFDESIDKNNDNDFTNDAEATGKTVNYKFKKTGTYIVTLTVQLGNTSKKYESQITVEEETESEDLWLIGMGFIIAGIVLFLIEASQPGFFIGIPATICIVLGLIAIAFPTYFFSPLSPIAALVFGILTTVGIIYLYKFVAPPEKPTTSVGEALIGRKGIVMVNTIPTSDTKGKVKLGSEIWSATSKSKIKKGTLVKVIGYEGVHLIVEKYKENN